jgi:acyl-CoA thioesterase-1
LKYLRAGLLLALAISLLACGKAQNQSESQPARTAPSLPPSNPTSAIAAPAPPSPTPADSRKVLVVFGDSLAAGFGLDAGQSFPDDLQKKLDQQGYKWRVVNLGISGDTTEGGVSRVDSATSLMPGIVVLELGGNDGLRGMPPDVTRMNLETMIGSFEKAGARVVLAGMTLPPNYGKAYIQRFEQIYKDLAKQYHVTLIPFLLSDMVTPDLHYFQRDGIHPTAAGAEIVADTVFRTVKPLLGQSVR